MTTIQKTTLSLVTGLLLALPARTQPTIQDRTYEGGEQVLVDGLGSITTSGSVVAKPGSTVTWEALSEITLAPGFHAQQGSDFTARVFNPNAFVLMVLDGDSQTAAPGAINQTPFDIAVWQGIPMPSYPVTFAVQQGGGSLLSSPTGPGLTNVTLSTDTDGTVRAWFKQPATPNTTSVIQVTAGTKSILLHSYNFDVNGSGGTGNGTGGTGNGSGGDNYPGNPSGNTPDWTIGNAGDNPAGFAVFSPDGDITTTGATGTPASALLTPAMTSNTAPAPWVASASSSWSTMYPYMAFDRKSNTLWGTGVSTFNTSTGLANSPQWVQIYTGGTIKTLTGLKLRSRGANPEYLTQAPVDFCVELSMDGVAWTTWLSATGVPPPTSLYQEYYSVNKPAMSFVYLRFSVLKITPGSLNQNTSFGEIELYGY